MIYYDQGRFKADEARSKKLLVTDAEGNPVEIKKTTPDMFWAVLDQRHRTAGASGKVVSRPSNKVSAERSLKKTPHGRVVQLKTDMEIGSLVYGYNIIPDNFARWG
jgi:hypothetical protein